MSSIEEFLSQCHFAGIGPNLERYGPLPLYFTASAPVAQSGLPNGYMRDRWVTFCVLKDMSSAKKTHQLRFGQKGIFDVSGEFVVPVSLHLASLTYLLQHLETNSEA